MSIIDHHPLNKALTSVLDAASPVPDMPLDRIRAGALAAFPYKKPMWPQVVGSIGALAATVVVGFGSFSYLQARSETQKALAADADIFAEQLISSDLASDLGSDLASDLDSEL